jgi:hypothetical protein
MLNEFKIDSRIELIKPAHKSTKPNIFKLTMEFTGTEVECEMVRTLLFSNIGKTIITDKE